MRRHEFEPIGVQLLPPAAMRDIAVMTDNGYLCRTCTCGPVVLAARDQAGLDALMARHRAAASSHPLMRGGQA